MEINLLKEISIGDKQISHFSSFTLQQQFNAHHYFELRFNHDQLGAPGLITLDDSRDFVGKTFTASFGYVSGQPQNFAGVVTKVELTQTNGYHGMLIVSGYSPTILIDRGPDLGSYLAKSLDAIVQLATKDTPVNDLRIVANASRKNEIDYVIQYRESDFDFLNRLSAEYHEWFFYDGENLNFGKPDQQKEVALFYGRDVQSLQYAMEVAPIKNKRFAYNPKEDVMLQSESTGAADGRPDLVHAINASNTMYSKTFNQPSLIRVDNGSDIKNHVDNEEKANISGLLKIHANGDNPEVGIGTIVDVTMSLKQEISFVTESLGKFLITSVTHTIDERGHYHNTFEGVVSTTERIAVKNYERPNPDMQLADVLDNNDPEGQGRIKVKLKWECQTNDPTEWLRVITPDAGRSESVSKNRGLVFIPEKGDQVLVSFEEGNVARPIVMGSVFHGKNGSGGSSSNNNKSITSKSGHTFTMDDAGGMLLKDRSGLNHISIDGTNAITVTSDNNVTLQTGNVMIIMDKENDKIIIQAKNIEIRAADDFKLTGDGAPSKNGSIEFQEKLSISSKNELFMVGETSAKLNSKEVNIVGSKTVIDGKPVKINS
jgi:type VI secretion system secreted protein VgrG